MSFTNNYNSLDNYNHIFLDAIIFVFYFYSVEWLIVDEADKLFEEGIRGFREQLDEITRACTNKDLRRAMFSATNTPAVSKWCRHNMKGLVTVTVGHRYNKCHVILTH